MVIKTRNETNRTVSLEKQTKRIVSSKGRTVQKTNHACADPEKNFLGGGGEGVRRFFEFAMAWGVRGILLVFL